MMRQILFPSLNSPEVNGASNAYRMNSDAYFHPKCIPLTHYRIQEF